MKKLLFASLLLFFGYVTYAQKANVKKALSITEDKDGNLSEALTLIDQATTNEETKDMPRTWYVRGKVFHAIGNATGKKYESLSKDPFKDAYESLRKAGDLDSVKKKMDDELKTEYQILLIDAFKKGSDLFKVKNFSGTLSMFELVLEIEKLPYYKSLIDTSVMYNAGIAANNAGQFTKALNYLTTVYNLKYKEENIYGQLSTAYSGVKDTAHALSILKEGYKNFPNNEYLLNSLLIYYVNTGEVTEAQKLIQIAKKNNPKSQIIYYAEAKMYENMQDIEKSAAAYEICLKLDSSSYNYYYNEGVLFYNKAVDIYKNSSKITDDKKYDEANNSALEYLKRALPKMEKAHAIKPENRTTVEVLKEIYYRLHMDDKNKAMKDLLDKMPK